MRSPFIIGLVGLSVTLNPLLVVLELGNCTLPAIQVFPCLGLGLSKLSFSMNLSEPLLSPLVGGCSSVALVHSYQAFPALAAESPAARFVYLSLFMMLLICHIYALKYQFNLI